MAAEIRKEGRAMRCRMLNRMCLTLLSTLVPIGCQYKELCYDHSHVVMVNVRYDWSGVEETASPAGMSTMLYDGRTGTVKRFDLKGMDGGTVPVEWGWYRSFGVNYGTESILFRGTEDPETFEAYTRVSSLEEGTHISTKVAMPKATGTEQQRITLEPDMLWAGKGDDFEADMGSGSATVTIRPVQRVTHFRILIEDVPNLQYTSQFGGSMSGLSGAVNLATGELSDECVIHSFPVRKEGDGTLVAEFNSFGHCPHEAEEGGHNEHMLTIYAILADGSKWYCTTDVTDQIHDVRQNPNPHDIVVKVGSLPIPKPIVNGSGFKPGIDGWVTEDIYVGM